MKLVSLLAALGVLSFSITAHALVMNVEVPPERQDYLPVAFEIVAERLTKGEIQFTVTITENVGSHSRFLEFPKQYGTALGIMRIIDYPKEGRSPNSPSRSEESRSIRSLASVQSENVIKCVFSVSEKELDNPDLAFFFSVPAPNKMPSGDNYFARLKKFVKR